MNNEMKKHVLDNGLRVYFYQDPSKHSTFVKLVTLVGSNCSDFVVDGKQYHIEDGLAHLVEHLVVETGTEKMFDIFSENLITGYNATTYMNRTEYYFHAVNSLEIGIKTLIKSVNNRKFQNDEIEKCKQPIYREIDRANDSKSRQMLYSALRNLFFNYQYESGLGTKENVKKFTPKLINLFHDTFYQPQNQILLLAGNFDENQILKLIKKEYSKLKEKHQFEIVQVDEPREVKYKSETIKMPTGKPEVSVFYKIYTGDKKELDRDKFLFYLNCMLEINFGFMSKLNKQLQDDKKIYGGLSTTWLHINDYTMVEISASTDYSNEIVDAITNVFKGDFIFDEELFELRKKAEKIDIIAAYEKPGAILNSFLTNLLSINRERLDNAFDIDVFNFEEYQKVINELDFNNYSITKLEDIEK